MENSEVNEVGNMRPTYTELMQAYEDMAKSFGELQYKFQILSSDKLMEKMHALMHIVLEKEKYSETIVNLAEWHLEQILAKPKE